MGQSNLADFTEDDSGDETPGGNAARVGDLHPLERVMQRAPPCAEPSADDSCPWCLASSDCFTTELSPGDSVGCGHCDASIPVDEDWYERGEKIVL